LSAVSNPRYGWSGDELGRADFSIELALDGIFRPINQVKDSIEVRYYRGCTFNRVGTAGRPIGFHREEKQIVQFL
jgi:hypothetical protein